MNKAAIETQFSSMIQENPIAMTFSGETHNVGVANLNATERQEAIGLFKSYWKSVWLVKSDWTSLPEKKNTVTIGGATFRVMRYRDYYLDAVRRLDLGDQYEPRGI